MWLTFVIHLLLMIYWQLLFIIVAVVVSYSSLLATWLAGDRCYLFIVDVIGSYSSLLSACLVACRSAFCQTDVLFSLALSYSNYNFTFVYCRLVLIISSIGIS